MSVHPFTTYVLRKYYQAIGWNEDNSFSNLTRSSDVLLDFPVPEGLRFSISKAPNRLFRTTYSMNALPSLNGTIGYIFSSCPLDLKNSGDVELKDIVDRFRIIDVPKKPEGEEEEWLAGERVNHRDYLISGLLHVPSGQLDAFYSTRWSSMTQASLACILNPSGAPSPGSNTFAVLQPSDTVLLNVQRDTGRWASEYTLQAEQNGSIFGLRVLRNFGKIRNIDHGEDTSLVDKHMSSSVKRVDQELATEDGLKGRLSAGAEIYLSTERSVGVSTGLRFTTIPDYVPYSNSKPQVTQPPTTITATFSPITGHLSTAYAAKVTRDVALCSRFTFNINSYESEWTVGGEWWINKKKYLQDNPPSASKDPTSAVSGISDADTLNSTDEMQGFVKAKLSTTSDMAFMWEGRMRNALVSFGVISNLINRSKPITGIGLELAYFSSE